LIEFFRQILNFLSNPNQPRWLGIFYAVVMGAVVFCQTLFLQSYFHRQYIVGLRFRSAITGLIYRKVNFCFFFWKCITNVYLEFETIEFS